MATLGKSFVDALKEGVQKSGEKDTKAFAKALDGMQRNVSGVANLFRGSELVTSLVVRDQLSSTVFSSATGWQIKGDGTATFRNVTVSGGSLLITNTTDRIHLQSDGDAFFGSNIGAPATTSLSIFSNAQTYNSESMGAGDILFGDNSANKANLLWDASEGKILFRGGTTTQGYVDTDGKAVFGAGAITLDSSGIRAKSDAGAQTYIGFDGSSIAANYSSSLTGVTVSAGAGYQYQTLRMSSIVPSAHPTMLEIVQSEDGATDHGYILMYSDSIDYANVFGGLGIGTSLRSQVTHMLTVFGGASIMGNSVFNEDGIDADLRVEGDTATGLLVCDAGLDAVQIGTTVAGAIADFRPATIVFNEASNDVDFRAESNGNANAITVDGGLDLVGILRAPASGDAALTVLGDMQASGYTGWNFANETWTYASASTFTVPTDLTAKYQKGTKLKLIQGTAKYFYVTGSSYSNPDTTVTITGGSDYALAQTELLTNGGFETAGGGAPDYFGTWTEAAGDGAIADEGTLVHGGSHAAKMTGGATPWTCSLYQNPAVVAGTTYQLTIWTRGDGTNAPYVGVLNEAWSAYLVGPYACPVGTTYVQTTLSFTIPVGDDMCSIILFAPPVNGGIAYFDDVSVTLGPITNPFYSYIENPQGFPDWFNWAPTYGASGSMTYTSVTTTYAKFRISGKTCYFNLRATGTTGGTAGLSVNATEPVAQAVTTNAVCVATALDAGNWVARGFLGTTGHINVGRTDFTTGDINWGLGAGRVMMAEGFYEF